MSFLGTSKKQLNKEALLRNRQDFLLWLHLDSQKGCKDSENTFRVVAGFFKDL